MCRKLARAVTIEHIGYTDAAMGFDCKTCGVLNAIQTQSPDIAMGVDTGGAGDQGLMFGYACDETAGVDAAADHAGAQAGAGSLREVRRAGHARFPAAGRQEPGQRGVRGRQAEAHRRRGGLDAAQRRRFPPRRCAPR